MIKTTAEIIKIGNSKGVRLPKKMLEAAKLPNKVELTVEDGKITISPAKAIYVNDEVLLSLPVLWRDWDSSEEDEAWKDL